MQSKYRQNLVTFGGKTGHFQLLNGLKKFNDASLITAVVGTWDSGGSSGILRSELGVLPPGDIRACLLALMEDDEQQRVAQRLFDDRLKEVTGPLKGHSLGNLIGVRLDHIFHGQDRGTDAERSLFRIRGQVLPATLTDLNLVGMTKNGIEISGESNIDKRKEKPGFEPKDRITRIYFTTHADSNPRVIEAIKKADKIIFAPGDLYTSVLPHLLIDGVAEAIQKSKAKVYFVLNLIEKVGETDYFKASDFIKAFNFYLGDPKRLNFLISNNKKFDREVVSVYEGERKKAILLDEDVCKKISPNLKIIKSGLGEYLKKYHLLRHNSKNLALAILKNG
ncbi:MAG TPA: gluconeogenesis factor YvcK family protein [Candidatus Saccharimonadales bacterium]|nr:gluconeogenesis factor YvcK family protein [Candidatus Saccharimonadales bacterium]